MNLVTSVRQYQALAFENLNFGLIGALELLDMLRMDL